MARLRTFLSPQYSSKQYFRERRSVFHDATYLCNERLALLNVLLELGQASFQQLLLLSGQLADGVNPLNTINLSNPGQHHDNGHYKNGTHAKLHVGREEVNALVSEQRALHKGRCDDTLLAVQTTEELMGELGPSIRH